jgi:uncharacterized protein (TIGR00297 family)
MLYLVGGFLLSLAISAVAYRGCSLSQSGVLGAIVVGTITFGLGGWRWGLLLIAFFVSSSLLSHYKMGQKEALAEKFAKGHRRDLGQVLANGGLGAFLATLHFLRPNDLFFVAFLGSMAAVSADTWATELGVLSPRSPRLITTGKVVPVGTSGGVTLWGIMASIAGALTMGAVAWLLLALGRAATSLSILFLAFFGGLLGSLFDSLLGATLQGVYFCPRCQVETERVLHRCGYQTTHIRGWPWFNNDLVNLASSLLGAVITSLLYLILA